MPRLPIFCLFLMFPLLPANRRKLRPLDLFLLEDFLPGLRDLPTFDGYPDDLYLLGTAAVDPIRLSLLLLHHCIFRNLPVPAWPDMPACRAVLVILLSPGGLQTEAFARLFFDTWKG